MDEQDAIARLQHGDIAGLEALVHLYQQPALRVAYLICGDAMQAEDIVQTAFVRVYERIDQFDATRVFRAWFLRIVANDALKAATRHQHRSLEETVDEQPHLLAAPDPDLETYLERAETREALWAAIEQLAPGQRRSVVLRYYLDLNDAEMAQILQCPPGTVRRRLHDARARLRRLLPGWIRPANATTRTGEEA